MFSDETEKSGKQKDIFLQSFTLSEFNLQVE